MGYYTTYTISVTPEPSEDLLAEDVDGETLCSLIVDEWNSKWYSHDDEMIALSKRWPDYLFRVDGEGEEQGDVWVAFYQAGEKEEHQQPKWEPPSEPSPAFMARVKSK